jgi:general stress protein 26
MDATKSTTETAAPERLWDMIKDIHIAILTTADDEGRLHSRPMATQQESFSGELWFLTQRHSGKVEEIRENAHVSLSYSDPGESRFVSVKGRASVSRDEAKIRELWNPMFKAWFPGGEDDPEIAVLKVTVDEAEYWEAPSNALVRNYRIMKRALTHGQSKVGEHETLTLHKSA